MDTAEALFRLYAHQDGVLRQLRCAARLTDLGPARAPIALAKARWQMVRMLRAYQLFKHTEIFDPAIASGSPIHAETARLMKENCLAASAAFDEHVRQWSCKDLSGCWDTYLAAFAEVALSLQRHVHRERTMVESLLAGSDRTRRLGVS